MPLPLQLLGSPADLLRIPGMKITSPRTPNTLPGRPRLPRSLTDSPYPADGTAAGDQTTAPAAGSTSSAPGGWSDPTFDAASSTPAGTDSTSGSGGMPVSDLLKNPNLSLSPGDRAAIAERLNPPQPKGGVRGAIGSAFNALGWNFIGDPLKNPGLAQWQARVQNYEDIGKLQDAAAARAAQMQNLALERQEAQQRITDAQQRAKDAALNAQRTSYDRRMKDIRSVGGFEAPNLPASIESQELPISPSLLKTPYDQQAEEQQADTLRNLPQRSPLMIPGLSIEQSGRLGTIEQVTDPDSQQTHAMVRPTKAVQQEMEAAGWPKVTPEMAATLSDMGLEEGTAVPRATYNRLLQIMQTRQSQANKPGAVQRPISVAPGHTVFDPTTREPIYTAPGKPEGDQKPPSRGQFAAVEARKQTALAKAETDARKRLRGSATVEPEDPDTVYSDLAQQKQQIQDAYEQEIGALTGNDVRHFQYSSGAGAPARTPTPNPVAQPPQPAVGRSVSEAELRRQAAAAGKDPDAAVQVARRRGYKLVQ